MFILKMKYRLYCEVMWHSWLHDIPLSVPFQHMIWTTTNTPYINSSKFFFFFFSRVRVLWFLVRNVVLLKAWLYSTHVWRVSKHLLSYGLYVKSPEPAVSVIPSICIFPLALVPSSHLVLRCHKPPKFYSFNKIYLFLWLVQPKLDW